MRPEQFRADPGFDARPGVDAGPVLIELGTDRGVPDEDAMPVRRAVHGWSAPLLVVLLVLISAAASAAPPGPPLSRVLSLRVQPADSYALTEDGMLLVHAPGGGTLTGYELSTGRQRWTAEATMPAYRVRSGAGLVLLRPRNPTPDPGTVVLSARTGGTRWQQAGSILTIAGAPTVLSVSEVRSVSGEGRRVEGPITGLDPQTGQPRWSLSEPSTAVLLGVPASAASPPTASPSGTPPPRLLLVHDNGVADLHDLATGQRLASVRLPPADYGPGNPGVSGGMVLLRYPGPSGPEVSGYDPATLQRRWTRPAAAAYEVRTCGRLACLIGRSGVLAIDPADGIQRWHRRGWRSIEQRGAVLLAYGSLTGTGDLVGVVDAATGQVEVALRYWRPVPGAGGGNHVLVTRIDQPGGRTMVAVAGAGAAWPRPLGELPAGTGDCRAVPHRLVCRSTSGELVVWSYSWR